MLGCCYWLAVPLWCAPLCTSLWHTRVCLRLLLAAPSQAVLGRLQQSQRLGAARPHPQQVVCLQPGKISTCMHCRDRPNQESDSMVAFTFWRGVSSQAT